MEYSIVNQFLQQEDYEQAKNYLVISLLEENKIDVNTESIAQSSEVVDRLLPILSEKYTKKNQRC